MLGLLSQSSSQQAKTLNHQISGTFRLAIIKLRESQSLLGVNRPILFPETLV
ncbi:hypothetical protein O53_4121 [Microcystis aeruginosa TAIHU98]|uniref:Uncharacterized protein n=1 Tax=Microcystis aeruginosa TAIHU98 TaxID=1134457 RepID=L7E738_MICAE|nr:hypothetical protein O53_4121 [Microcystis aeruginosa TAIHU98]